MTTDTLRQITGVLRTPEGSPFPNKTLTWFRERRTVLSQGSSIVLDEPFYVTTSNAGAIDHSVMAGTYLVLVKLKDADRYFRVSVPDQAGPFNIADLVDAPTVTPEIITQVQALVIEARAWAQNPEGVEPNPSTYPDEFSARHWAGNSRAWAEGEEPGGAGTKSARQWSETARGWVEQIPPEVVPIVVVASGQSNMDGVGDGGTMPPEDASVQMFDLQTRAFRPVSYTNRISRTNVNSGTAITIPAAAGKNNLAFAFCHAAHEATGRPVYLIIVSNGGTHIGRWVGSDAASVAAYAGPWGPVGTAKPLYVELQNAVTEALALIGVTKIDAFLWHQGETKRPGYESPAAYEADFATLRAQLEVETWWSDSTQLIVGEQIIGSYYQNAENYNDIWRALNDDGDPYTKAVSGEGLAMNAAIASPDSVHYDGQSLYELGRRYWRAFLGDKTALARRADPETTVYGAKSLTYQWSDEKFNVAKRIDPLFGRIVDEKRPAPVRSGGGYQAGQRVVNATSCSVAHNSDGTFTVTPNGTVAENWSFDIEDFWQEWPGVTKAVASNNQVRITGSVDLSMREKFRLWLDADTSASLNLSYTPWLNGANANADDLLQIDWGDGTVDTGLAKGTHSHTYSSAYSGWVIVSLPGCCEITAIISSDGRWRSPLANFSHLSQLSYLSIGADNRMYGDMRDLPDSMVTCILQGNNICTWDFSGLPNLKNLTAQGANTINAPRRFSEMRAFTRLILDGSDRTTAQIDDVLIAMSQVMAWDGTRDIFLNYPGQAPRSSASDTAVAELVARGVTVNVNS